jgi:DNA-binding transcriptional ArsR family regulator
MACPRPVPRNVAANARRRVSRRPLDELFGALADPTRRQLLERLIHEGPHTATQLATGSAVSRQAIVKHLQALTAVDLVAAERCGREVRYRATTEPLANVVDWLRRASADWDRRAERLQRQLTS